MVGAGWCETKNITKPKEKNVGGQGISYAHCLKKWGTRPPCLHLMAPMVAEDVELDFLGIFMSTQIHQNAS